MAILVSQESSLGVDDFVDILERSGLAERRPVRDRPRVAKMREGADLIVVARDDENDGRLVGVSRCITDFAYCCYCSDLAVDRDYQGRGIGADLISASREHAGEGCAFFLISAPAAESYYEHIGMPRIERVFGWMKPGDAG